MLGTLPIPGSVGEPSGLNWIKVPVVLSLNVYTMLRFCPVKQINVAIKILGFVDIGWKCVAHAGIFFVQPIGIPDDPDGDLLGFSLTLPNTYDMRRVRLMRTAKQALDYAEGKNGY